MSDNVLPKNKTAVYQRWEMPEFTSAGLGSTSQPSSSHTRPKLDNRNGVVLPTAAQLQEIQSQAHDEGYQAAYAEGSQRIAALLQSLEQALQLTDQNIAQDLLNLSLEVARQMVKQVINTNPEVLLNIIREAIASLPHFNQGAYLILHPDDAAMVREKMGEQLAHSGWKILEDALISIGGVRIETAHSQIDATLENRWQRIVASIGQDSSWIQE
ncbi:MAG: flagellar assembly protein FliH [Gallionellaceae bacterium]|jgi:flagellar assembly protein FliH